MRSAKVQELIDMSKKKYYVVWSGRQTGVFADWEECKAQVDGYEGALYKSFPTEQAATAAFESELDSRAQIDNNKPHSQNAQSLPIVPSLCVDAACSGNPGQMEYRGVYLLDIHQNGERETQEFFHRGLFRDATNNIGEFLALVHALALLHKQGNTTLTIYSDSRTAIAWVRNKNAKTKLQPTSNNQQLFHIIKKAENWLLTHPVNNPILKWDTTSWGEIPADFGRK